MTRPELGSDSGSLCLSVKAGGASYLIIAKVQVARPGRQGNPCSVVDIQMVDTARCQHPDRPGQSRTVPYYRYVSGEKGELVGVPCLCVTYDGPGELNAIPL